jgi:metal-responsive CopG/Arc/MetJ family transcriptional regulator
MKNIQVTVDEETLRRVDRAAKPLGLKRSEIVRDALREWLQRRRVEQFEAEWIASLHRHRDDPARADDWLDSQAWGRK